MDSLKEYDYKNVLKYFTDLCAIPHGSGNVKEISDFLLDFAKKQGVSAYQDEALNVCAFLPATAGYEDKPTLMLQGHMDMVCEKDAESSHDFKTDPLDLFLENGWLGARGTTLGGDDGAAVAIMMAMMADKEFSHPAMELVITTDEETGMDGAKALDLTHFKAKYLVNLDSEAEGIYTCGCAGGERVSVTFRMERTDFTGQVIKISLNGLKGGHSGVEINRNRTNANKAMARFLFTLREKVGFAVSDIHGGKLDNAIPRECFAEISVPSFDEKEFTAAFNKVREIMKYELLATEPDADISFELPSACETETEVFNDTSTEKLLYFLINCPNGVQRMSGKLEGLVESSLNMGILYTADTAAVIRFSLRSSVYSYREFMRNRIAYLAEVIGGETETEGGYPGWDYEVDTHLQKTYASLYRKEYDKEPVMAVIHAGLECGLIKDRMKDLDIISIGPDMKDIHSPNERLNLESVVRVYKFVEKLAVEL